MLNINRKKLSQPFSYKLSLECFNRSIEIGVSYDELKQLGQQPRTWFTGLSQSVPQTIRAQFARFQDKIKNKTTQGAGTIGTSAGHTSSPSSNGTPAKDPLRRSRKREQTISDS